jgi:hypothetical protein
MDPGNLLNFYVVKNHKIDNNAKTTEAREKRRTDLESLEFLKQFDVNFNKFKNN